MINFCNNDRTPAMLIVERLFFNGKSCLDNADDETTKKLIKGIHELDSEWFNFMPAEFFVKKYNEELNELREAHKSLMVTNNSSIPAEDIDSLMYAFFGELSDVILASSSAIAERKISREVVYGNIKDIIEELDSNAKKCNKDLRISEIEVSKVLNAHSNKIDELIFAKNVYSSFQWGTASNWRTMMLKIYSFDELLNPANKMQIVKEIRRMKFAMKNLKDDYEFKTK